MTTENIAVANMIIASAGIVSWLLLAILHKRKWLWSIPPITVFLHVIVFYVVRLSISTPEMTVEMRQFLNAWSSGIRFHELILLTGMGIILAWERVKRWITRRSLLRS